MKKILLWCAVILMSMQIFGFSSKTANESSELSKDIAGNIIETIKDVTEVPEEKNETVFQIVHMLVRKGAHILEFSVLSVLVFFLARSYGLKNSVCIIISMGYCLLFAITDEVHQLFVTGRSCEFRDILLDFCGGIIANAIIALGFSFKKIDKK